MISLSRVGAILSLLSIINYHFLNFEWGQSWEMAIYTVLKVFLCISVEVSVCLVFSVPLKKRQQRPFQRRSGGTPNPPF